MEITVNHTEKGKLITLHSRTLATGNLRAFRDQMLPELAGGQTIYLDLGEVQFIDSAGLGALISCLRVCSNEASELILTGLNKNVKTLFSLMRVERVFRIEELEAAQ